MVLKKILMIVLMLSVLTGCTDEESLDNKNTIEDNAVQSIDYYGELELSDEEIHYIENLKSEGKLRVALRQAPFIYYVEEGVSKGFHYRVIELFARMVELELELVVIDFQDFWTIDGIVPDEVKVNDHFFYTPDLINEVHIYTDQITVLPWREKLVDFISIHPTREVLIHKNDLIINDISDIDGLRAVLMRESSSLTTLGKITDQTGYTFHIETVEESNDRIKYVSNNLADFTILDINRAVVEVEAYDTLKVGIPVSEVEYIGWAVKRDNKILAAILNKYFHYIKESGEFDAMWSESYPIDFMEYMKLLSD